MLEHMRRRDAAAASAIAWSIVEAAHAAVRAAIGAPPGSTGAAAPPPGIVEAGSGRGVSREA
jgi:hypothetical protein